MSIIEILGLIASVISILGFLWKIVRVLRESGQAGLIQFGKRNSIAILLGLLVVVLASEIAFKSISRFHLIKLRGHVVCGINEDLPGFSVWRSENDAIGFDAAFCKVIAVAIFGRHEGRVKYKSVKVKDRFKVVEDGDVDVLIRNTTWTVGRDIGYKIDFGPTIFHDKQMIMVPHTSNINSVDDLSDSNVCVLPHTTSKVNLEAFRDLKNVQFDIVLDKGPNVPFQNNDEIFEHYLMGSETCDAVSADMSQLIARTNGGEGHRLLPGSAMSREPLSPVFIQGDTKLREIVSYAVFATIYADQLDINSQNVDSIAMLPNASVIHKGFLGIDDHRIKKHIGEELGIRKDFALQIVKQVGSYSEIYRKFIGSRFELFREPGENQAYNRSSRNGLLISPPFTTLD